MNLVDNCEMISDHIKNFIFFIGLLNAIFINKRRRQAKETTVVMALHKKYAYKNAIKYVSKNFISGVEPI